MFKIATPISTDNANYQHYASDNATIEAAMHILAQRMRNPTEQLESPEAAKKYLQLQIGALDYEAFWVVYMDPQARVLAVEEAWRGSVSTTPAYPREIAKRALELNAVGVLVAHNHPSGAAKPSKNDRMVTRNLVRALEPLEINVLDHYVISGTEVYSFDEHKELHKAGVEDFLSALFGMHGAM